MKRMIVAAISAAALLMSAGAHAQQTDFSKVEIKTTDLGHDTYMLAGQGGNITVAVGSDAILIVDTEFAPLHDKIKAAIAALSPLPVRTVVNTHYHGDHTGGNAAFAKEGAAIVAHANVKKRLDEGATNALTGAKTPPAPANAPTMPYTDKPNVALKGRTVRIAHAANAHTDGDSYVFFPDANVLATGDIVSVGGRYPNIDVGVGGNIKGIIAAVDTYLKLANDTTKIVPGHGALMNKTQLAAYRVMLVTARDRVQKLIGEGKSEDDAVAARPLADLDTTVGAPDQASANFVRLIYKSLKT
jgi:glyoxylase-like metal-dependent hydrolase (beta-lactamase superfamily II)